MSIFLWGTRSLAACEGATNCCCPRCWGSSSFKAYLAIENGYDGIPVINKVELSSAMVAEVTIQVLEPVDVKKAK